MKKLLLATAALALVASTAQATNTDPIFYANQGKLIIPNLKLGTATYWVMLRQQGSTYNFSLDGASVLLIPSPLGYTPATASEIVGTWAPAFDLNSTFTLNANNTYSMLLAATPGDADCPNGGPETGTYSYEPTTGVAVMVASTDGNGQCGFSHPDGPLRFKKVGTDIYIMMKDEGKDVEAKLTKKP